VEKVEDKYRFTPKGEAALEGADANKIEETR